MTQTFHVFPVVPESFPEPRNPDVPAPFRAGTGTSRSSEVQERETGTSGAVQASLGVTVLAIDPGNEQSAYVVLHDNRLEKFGKVDNARMLELADELGASLPYHTPLAIEMIASYGMPVGREVFETCVMIGRCMERWPFGSTFVYRRDVKLHLCGSARAKDGNIRQALVDRYGGKVTAIGKKATPGPLYGVSADVWAALAVAVTYSDTHHSEQPPLNPSTRGAE